MLFSAKNIIPFGLIITREILFHPSLSRISVSLINKMSGFSTSETINQPREFVFGHLVNLDNFKNWMPGVLDIKINPNVDIGKGTKYIETRRFKSGEGDVQMEVLDFQAPELFVTSFYTGGVFCKYEYFLKKEGSKTIVSLTCKVKVTGHKKIWQPLIAWAIKLQDKNQLKALKASLENS